MTVEGIEMTPKTRLAAMFAVGICAVAAPGAATAAPPGVGFCVASTSGPGTDSCTMTPTSNKFELYCYSTGTVSAVATATWGVRTWTVNCTFVGQRCDPVILPLLPVTLTVVQTSGSGSATADVMSEGVDTGLPAIDRLVTGAC